MDANAIVAHAQHDVLGLLEQLDPDLPLSLRFYPRLSRGEGDDNHLMV
jgi:hypothetical protein